MAKYVDKLFPGTFYRNTEPNVSLQIEFEDKNRKKEVTFSRLGPGKCYSEYLTMMKIVDSDKCRECNIAVETMQHLPSTAVSTEWPL